MWITCKFGGTSLATSENIKKCCDIIQADENRKFIVVSAPGKKSKQGKKVTDLLHECYQTRFDEARFSAAFAQIQETFEEVATLVPSFPIKSLMQEIRAQIVHSEANQDFVLSRGEYINAKIISAYLGCEFLDAASFIRFKKGELDLEGTLAKAKELKLLPARYVIPGFYGVDESGHIKAFSRGGSDITGAIVARVFGCGLYENWTDVDGIHVCDPKIVANSKQVAQVSFRELREMSYMGASVLHAETLLPIYETPIPIHLKNTFEPHLVGTEILKKRTHLDEKETITCITGKNDYTCIQISKMMLDKQLGFVKKVTSVFEEYDINISHTHSGLDNLCFFVEEKEYVKISFRDFVEQLKARINADKIQSYEKMALLAIIGHNLSGKVGILSKIFNALKENDISVKTIYQSISECNVIIGIDNRQLNKSIQALYHELIPV